MKTLSINDFDNLYRQYGPMVLRRCRTLLKNEEKALDAMQDVFVRLIERKEKISKICHSAEEYIAGYQQDQDQRRGPDGNAKHRADDADARQTAGHYTEEDTDGSDPAGDGAGGLAVIQHQILGNGFQPGFTQGTGI